LPRGQVTRSCKPSQRRSRSLGWLDPFDQQPQLYFDALGGQLWKCLSTLAVPIDVAVTVDRVCSVKDIGALRKVALLH
jgi:hypothetical protein